MLWRVCSTNEEYKRLEGSETDIHTHTHTDRTGRRVFNVEILIFIFKLDTFVPIKHTGWLELKWEEVRETERGNKTSFQQLPDPGILHPFRCRIPGLKINFSFKFSVFQTVKILCIMIHHSLYDNHIIMTKKNQSKNVSHFWCSVYRQVRLYCSALKTQLK